MVKVLVVSSDDKVKDAVHRRLTAVGDESHSAHPYSSRCRWQVASVAQAIAVKPGGRNDDAVAAVALIFPESLQPADNPLSMLQDLRQALDNDIPIVVLVNQRHEATALDALQAGAQDYLIVERLTPHWASRTIDHVIKSHHKDQQLARKAQQIQTLQSDLAQEVERRLNIERNCEQDIQDHTEELEAEIVQRQRVEKRLHHQVANLEIIFRAFPDAIIFLDNNRRIRKVSAALTTLFGYQPGEILGQPMGVLYHNPEDCLILGEQRFSVFAEETFEPYSIYYQRQDGSTFVGETIGTIVKDEMGRIMGFLGIIHDMTRRHQLVQERDKAQAELACREAQLQQFVTYMPAAIAMFDTEMRHLFHSDRWLADHSLTGVDITGKSHYDVFPNLSELWKERHQYCLEGQVLQQDEEVIVQDDGSHEWIKWEIRPWYETPGQIGGILVLTEVITARKTAQLQLEDSEARFRAFMDNNLAIAFMKNEAGQYLYVNKPFEQFAGISQTDLIAKTGAAWLPDNIAQRLSQHDSHVLATGEASQRLEIVPTADGTATYWMVCKFPCSTATGKALGGVAFNITEQKRIEQELFREKELAQVTLQSIGDAVITTDAQGNITYLNSAAERLTAWPLSAAMMQPLLQVFHAVDEMTGQRVPNPASHVLQTGEGVDSMHMTLIARDGQEYSIVDSAAPIRDRNGGIVGVVLVFHDVTESRALSQQLVWQASHDTLTNLKNRRYFESELTAVLEQPQRQHVLCYLDLDRFKVVNDTGGHAAGDELLRQIGAILAQNTRSADVVARLGGDEFGILLKQCSLENARRVMDLIRQVIMDFRFAWDDKTFSVGVSIGMVEINDTILNLADALGAADAACYAAKERGRNRLYLYHADDQELSRQRKEQQWITRIQQALDQNQFQLYRQPIAPASLFQDDLRNGTAVHHYEILLRLINGAGDVIPPMAFIPAAERYGLMPAIDRWVVKTFFHDVALLQSPTSSRPDFYTLNLSGASINDDQFLPFLKEQILHSQISPEALCFEITETVAVSNLNRARDFIHDIKQLGCSFALDDFGSGMSSFGYLKHLAVNYIKIDGSFVRNLLEDNISTSIVEAITNIAHSMGLKAIAERVENTETQRKLLELNVDYVQGYGIGKPAPLPVILPAPVLAS